MYISIESIRVYGVCSMVYMRAQPKVREVVNLYILPIQYDSVGKPPYTCIMYVVYTRTAQQNILD